MSAGKILRWFISNLLVLFGISMAAALQQQGEVWPFMPMILSFGAAYLVANKLYETPQQYLFTAVILVLSGFCAHYFYFDFLLLNSNVYVAWANWMLIIGLPAWFLGSEKFGF